MPSGYWSKVVSRRIGRRRALTLVGSSAAAAAFLAACGSDDDDSGQSSTTTTQSGTAGSSTSASATGTTGVASTGPAGSESLIADPIDTSAQAVRGGIYADYHFNDENTLDPMTTTRGAGQGGFELPSYQKMLREVMAPGGTPRQTFEGDAAESFELSPDGLKLVMKLRPNNHFDPREPTNGRLMTAEDVVYSWNSLVARSTYASIIAYEASDAVPVQSATATDENTVVFDMAFPWAALLPAFAEGGPFVVVPVEMEDKFDPKNTVRGSGPWMLEYEPSVAFRWRRNPGYFDADLPYLDGYEQPILPEYAGQLAQFRAKNVWDFRPEPADLAGLVQDMRPAGVRAYQGAMGISHIHMYFPGRPGGIFRDVRMRRAASVAIDRVLLAEVRSEAARLEAIGLPPEIVINNNIAAGYPDFWLDPFGAEMGDAAQWFKFNRDEAKALLSAAGYPNGVDVVAKVSSASHGSGQHAEIIHEMLREVGIRVDHQTVDYNTIYLPNILRTRGDWDGDLTYSGGGTGFSPATGLQRVWHWDGGTTRVSCLSQPCDDEHRAIGEAIERALKEIDPEEYRSQIHELQRMMGSYQGAIITDFQTAPIDLVWPWVQNWNVFRGVRNTSAAMATEGVAFPYRHLWIDESKKT